MSPYRYRAATAAGALRQGVLDGVSVADVLDQVRRTGLTPIEAVEVKGANRAVLARGGAGPRPTPSGLVKLFGEMAVMLDAGVPLDRALSVLGQDLEGADRTVAQALLDRVAEGKPLSRAVGEAGRAFPPMAAPMIAAGEADGRLGSALARLAQALERGQALRATLVSAAVYPALLILIALGVVALMLFWVVPQFEILFSDAQGKLPAMTLIVLGVSRAARSYGVFAVLALAAAGFGAAALLRRPEVRAGFDRLVLRLPVAGPLLRMTESARFVRVLAGLVQAGVNLPEALSVSGAVLVNGQMSRAIAEVAQGLREGEGLTTPLAATGVLPRLAISYIRTGEETAQLPLMLDRLADTLDREARVRLERLVGALTPIITVAMGAVVAVVMASLMTAILGFDDLTQG